MEVATWGGLLQKLSQLTDEQLQQPIQYACPPLNRSDIEELLPGVAFASVRELEFYCCRSTHNNRYCKDDLVLLLDVNSFAEDGAIGYTFGETADVTLYSEDGPTPPEAQMSPQALAANAVMQ